MELLRYEGSVREFKRALRSVRPVMRSAGMLAEDDVNRRRFQRRLREAEMASIRAEILRGGGDVA